MRVLIVGASGFNGRALARRLKNDGHFVRGLVRDPSTAPEALDEVVVGDVVRGSGLAAAMKQIDVAYYFVHSLEPGKGTPADRDLTAARNFADVAAAAQVSRVVFLTTLAPPEGEEPPIYQRNRLSVEQVLREALPQLVILRSPLVVGSGSRALRPYFRLVQRVPVIPLGPWRSNTIAVVDAQTVEDCLVDASDSIDPGTWDIPASAEPSHEELVRGLADALGIRRWILRLPFAIPAIDARLMSIVTGESYAFCRTFISASELPYATSPARHAPTVGSPAAPLVEILTSAVTDWDELPRYRHNRALASRGGTD